MANPTGVPKMSSDANVQDVYFKFTIGASGAVTAKDFSTDIKDITLGSAGTYTVLLREQWSDIAAVEIRSISTTFHQFQVTQNNVASATPSVVFITAVSDGTPVAENLANPTQIRGYLQLRNGPK
jgi:hypothetical protein